MLVVLAKEMVPGTLSKC